MKVLGLLLLSLMVGIASANPIHPLIPKTKTFNYDAVIRYWPFDPVLDTPYLPSTQARDKAAEWANVARSKTIMRKVNDGECYGFITRRNVRAYYMDMKTTSLAYILSING